MSPENNYKEGRNSFQLVRPTPASLTTLFLLVKRAIKGPKIWHIASIFPLIYVFLVPVALSNATQ